MKSKICISVAVLICGLALHASHARAQSFRLNTFRSAERPDDGFGVRRLGAFEHMRWGALLTADYAHDPLVIERKSGGNAELARIVRHQLTLKLDLSLALWNRLIIFAGLEAQPLVKGNAVPAGFDLPSADGGGMGDVGVGARVRLLGDADDLFALGVQAALIVPTAGSQAYRGEDGVAVRPELIAELRPKVVRISVNVGTLVREQQRLFDARLSSQLLYAAALAVPIMPSLELLGELWGNFAYKDFGGKRTTPVEWLLGGKYKNEQGWFAGLAAGRGLSHGVGAPDGRVVVQVGYLRPAALPIRVVAEPAPPAPVPSDNDSDGLLDVDDRCPDQAEDRDGFEDGDGCPEPDNDLDLVVDVEDVCPDLPGTPAERGCPGKLKVTDEGEIVVFQQILFENNQAAILAESVPNMEAVQKVLQDNPMITKVRIEGHTDSVGQDDQNLALSQQRAAAVAHWLVQHGIESKRLEAFGCGEKHPVVTERTPKDRAKNRRVVFQTVEPALEGASTATPPEGCLPAPVE